MTPEREQAIRNATYALRAEGQPDEAREDLLAEVRRLRALLAELPASCARAAAPFVEDKSVCDSIETRLRKQIDAALAAKGPKEKP